MGERDRCSASESVRQQAVRTGRLRPRQPPSLRQPHAGRSKSCNTAISPSRPIFCKRKARAFQRGESRNRGPDFKRVSTRRSPRASRLTMLPRVRQEADNIARRSFRYPQVKLIVSARRRFKQPIIPRHGVHAVQAETAVWGFPADQMK
jgi:hypothetical protein